VLTGYVADETLALLYRRAKAFVFPSLHEGFGLPVLEAMAAGTPVITSRRSALPEVGADAALYVDAEDEEAICVAIERVLSDPVLRSELVEKGRTWSAKFRWEGTCRELSAIFHELANGADVKR
jgi:glycosyltransferase involved in cell wall biosynthesis